MMKAKMMARPTTLTGTAMAILVFVEAIPLEDEPPSAELWVGAEVKVEVEVGSTVPV
jgi:hypothetical protein